jgi:hypothetical protein
MKFAHLMILRELCPDRVADILEACGALDPGSSPGRDAFLSFDYPIGNFSNRSFVALHIGH